MNTEIVSSLKKILSSINTRVEKLANFDSVKNKRPMGYEEVNGVIQQLEKQAKEYTSIHKQYESNFSTIFKAVKRNSNNIDGLRKIVFKSMDRKVVNKEDIELNSVDPKDLESANLRYDADTQRMHSTREEDKNKMVSFDDSKQQIADVLNNKIEDDQPDAEPVVPEEPTPDAEPIAPEPAAIGINSDILTSIHERLISINESIKTFFGDKDKTKFEETAENNDKQKKKLFGGLLNKKDKVDKVDKGKSKGANPMQELYKLIFTTVLSFLPTLILWWKSKKKELQEKVITPLVDFFAETIPEFFSKIASFFTETIPNWISEKADAIKEKLKAIGDAVKGVIDKIRNKLADIIEAIANGLSGMKGFLGDIIDKIKGMASRIRAGAQKVGEKLISQPQRLPDDKRAKQDAIPSSKGKQREQQKITPEQIKRLRKIEDVASRTNDEWKLVDLATEYLQILNNADKAKGQDVEKLVNKWLDKYYSDGYSSPGIGTDAQTGDPTRFSIKKHFQERVDRAREKTEAIREELRSDRGDKVAKGSMEATDPEAHKKYMEGRKRTQAARDRLNQSRRGNKVPENKIDVTNVPDPTPNLSLIANQLFYVGKDAA